MLYDTAPQRHRNFIFTANNYTDATVAKLKALPWHRLVAAHEVGESGTPHLQGYVNLKSAKTLPAVVKAAPGCHWTVCNSPQKAEEYCRKGEQSHAQWDADGTAGEDYGVGLVMILDEGEPSAQGKRTDLQDVIAAVAAGKRKLDIAQEMGATYIRYSKGIEAYYAALDKPRDRNIPMTVIVHYGPTGSGKTWLAMEKYPDLFKYSLSASAWFDGYERQDVALFDEYRGQLPFGHLLQLLDVYPLKVQVKGSFREWVPETIIITSPVHPALWYDIETLAKKKNEGGLNQLQRRIDAIYYFPNTKFHPNQGQPVTEDHTNKKWTDFLDPEAAAMFEAVNAQSKTASGETSSGAGGSNDSFPELPQFDPNDPANMSHDLTPPPLVRQDAFNNRASAILNGVTTPNVINHGTSRRIAPVQVTPIMTAMADVMAEVEAEDEA